MTDPMTPLTDESEALLAEVHGTQMALTVFPSRLRAIEAAAARRALEGSGAVSVEAVAPAINGMLSTGWLMDSLTEPVGWEGKPNPHQWLYDAIVAAEKAVDAALPHHARRCENPDRYPDYCHCVPDLLTDLIAAVEARAIEGSGVVRTVQAKRPPSGVDSHMAGWVRWDKPMDPITCLLANLDYESYEVDAVGGGKVRCWKFSEWPDTLRRAVETVRAALSRPEEPRVERCAFVWKSGTPCGKPKRDSRHKHDSSCLTGGEGHITDMLCHPFTPEAR